METQHTTATVEELVNTYCERLNTREEDNNARFVVDTGRGYFKLVRELRTQQGDVFSRSAGAFIRRNDGRVFRAASWSKKGRDLRIDMRLALEHVDRAPINGCPAF